MRNTAALLSLLLLACAEPTRFHAFTVGDTITFTGASEMAFATGQVSADWTSVDFDDSQWKRGSTRLGTGSDADTRLADSPDTLHIRARFDAGPQARSVEALRLDVDVRGGSFDAQVNGVSVLSGGEPLVRYVVVPAGTLRPTGNVVALLVRPYAREPLSIGLTVDPIAPAQPAGIVRGPYLQDLREDGVTVVFDTAVVAAGRVVVGTQVFEDAPGLHHEVAVRGLAPGTRHAYHVEAAGARSEELELATAPGRGEVVTLVVYGDTRTDGDDQRRLCAAMAREDADAALSTGDLVDESSDEEWATFFAIEYGFLARTPLYAALGNHDDGGASAERFRRAFVYPDDGMIPERVYGFDVGDVHVAVLDSNARLAEQAAWLDRDLAAARARGATHLFVLIHHGPYSAGDGHGGSPAARELLVPVARRHHVDAIFSGHDHIYERGNASGLRYFVSGGGGAPLHGVDPTATTERALSVRHYLLVRVVGASVTVQAKSLSGELVDTVSW